MKYLVFADLHSFHEEKLELVNIDFDVLVLLGDIHSGTILKILQSFPSKPVVGVLGNHDSKDLFNIVNSMVMNYNKLGLNISKTKSLNEQVLIYGDDTITGFEGVPGVFDSELTITQATASSRIILAADILFSHETGYHYLDDRDVTHEGFHIISDYIEQVRPKYHIFGHHHKNLKFQKGDTKCFCVYGCSVFDSDSGTISNIFEE